MVIGLDEDEFPWSLEKEPFADYRYPKEVKPLNKHLKAEIARRQMAYGFDKDVRPKNWKKDKLEEWLTNNPIPESELDDLSFLKEELSALEEKSDKKQKPQLKWVKGPTTPPGEFPNISVFRQELKNKIPPGRKVIADDGYKGEPERISLRNEFDPREIAEFKERVMARHETFNQRLKNFNCLSQRFRHGIERHKVSFEAVCVIVMMYEMEYGGTSLFDPYL